MELFFTYVLKCIDGTYYIGSTADIKRRFAEHCSGNVQTTSKRLPVELVYYEACPSKVLSQKRERYFKTGYGRGFLKTRIGLK
jgi:putative endonuclease